jgi:hypothetical protein
LTAVPDTPFVTGEAFEQLLAGDIFVTPTGKSRTTLANALAATAGGSVTQVVTAAGPFLSGVTITNAGTITSSLNPTAHGVLIGQGVSAVAATAAMTSGQILVGQGASADPLPRTVGGDVTMNNLGNFGLINSGVTAGTYGNSGSVAVIQVDAAGRILAASNVGISATSNKLSGTFTANGSIVAQLPALANIIGGSLNNTTTIAVVVGMGTTAGATDIMDATTIAASDITPIPSSAFGKLAFLANQTIFVDSTAWAGASVNVSLWYAQ